MRDVTPYFAADHAEVLDNQDEANNYPQEFLWTLTPYGKPPNTLEVKGWVHCYVADEPRSKKPPMEWHWTFCVAFLQK